MVHQLAEAHREGTDVGRHQHIGTTGRLRSALQKTVVDGAHLVGVVGEVGGRPGIVERELATDEQARLVVAGREGAAEGSAGLAVRHIRIGEEDALRRREAVAQLAGLADEAVLYLHTVEDARPVGDDRVFADNSRSDVHAVVRPAHDGAVADARGSADLAVVHDDGVRYLLRTRYLHVVADGATLGCRPLDVLVDESADAVLDGFVVEVFHHEGSKLAVQVGEEDGIAVARLVQHADQVALSVGSSLGGLHHREVRYEAVVADGIVVDIAADVLDEAVVADDDVAQRGVADARMLVEAARYLDVLLKHTEEHLAIERYVAQMVRVEIVSYVDGCPVFCRTSVIFQDANLFVSQ